MKMLKNILTYGVLGGLLAIPFIPFIVPSGMFFPFISGKGFAFRIIVEIIFGLFVVLAFLDKEYRPKFSLITKAVLFFTLVIFFADLFSANPYKSFWSNYERMEGFVLIAHLALYYLVASSVLNTKVRWNTLLTTSIVASAIMSFYGLLQVAGAIVINQGGNRVDATFGNASYLAIYLVFHIFLCLYFIVDTTKPKWQKWMYGLVGILNLVILYFTATRGAILGLLGGLALAGLLIAWKERENRTFRKVSYWTLGGLVVLVGIFFSVRNTSFVENNFILSRFSTLSFSEIKTQGRYFVWPMAIKGFAERPLLGWGQESFNFVFNKYYDPRMYGQEQWFDRTHDIFLDWLIAGGLLGLLSYLSMYGALLYYIWRKESEFTLAQKSIFTGMISAYLFHNTFVFDNLISYILFFTVLAFVHFESYKVKSEKAFYAKNFQESTVAYVVLPTVLVLTIAILYFVNIPAYQANRTLISAITPQGDAQKNLELFKKVYSYNSFGSTEATEQIVEITTQVYSSQLPDNIKQEFFNLAKQKIEEKVAESPKDTRYLVFAGSFFNRFGQYDEAIKYLERAIVESPKKQTIYFELGTAYIGKKDLNKMFEVFKRAYDLEPTAPESKIIYTIGAIYTRNNSVLQQMSSQISREIIVSDVRFLKAYSDVGEYGIVSQILEERLKSDPKNAQNKLYLASTYATLGQKQKAIDLIKEVIAENPTFKEQGEQYIKEIQQS